MTIHTPGHHMAKESAEAMAVFRATAARVPQSGHLDGATAIYTVARGSSDAAANILSYEFMRELGIPATSLPPSVFSIGAGIALPQAVVLMVSQSGASDDLVQSAKGAKMRGAKVVAITNQPGSAIEQAADVTVPIGAGPELAVPATKTVVGSVAAGQALLASARPDYAARLENDLAHLAGIGLDHPRASELQSALLRADHVYVIGRDTGFGAAHEVALKLKECCALHAEHYSASEVLHGPLQLATNPLLVLLLDTGAPEVQDSLDKAQSRFAAIGCTVIRISPADVGAGPLTPATAAALLFAMLYPVILRTALALGMNPDSPATLSKVTQTR